MKLTFFAFVLTLTALASPLVAQAASEESLRIIFNAGYHLLQDSSILSKELTQYQELKNSLEAEHFSIQSESQWQMATLGSYEKRKGEAIDEKVLVEEVQGCDQLDSRCIQSMDRWNGPYWRLPDYEGRINVPTKLIRYTLVIQIEKGAERQNSLAEILARYPDTVEFPGGKAQAARLLGLPYEEAPPTPVRDFIVDYFRKKS